MKKFIVFCSIIGAILTFGNVGIAYASESPELQISGFATLEKLGTFCLTFALLQILFAPFVASMDYFSIPKDHRNDPHVPHTSTVARLVHVLAEGEGGPPIWTLILFVIGIILIGYENMKGYLESVNIAEPMFVGGMVLVASTKPVLDASERIIMFLAQKLPLPGLLGFFAVTLTLGPLLGSFITEPAAMVVVVSLVMRQVKGRHLTRRFLYLLLGVICTNVSVGGALTPIAAPAIVVIADSVGWDIAFTMQNFGPKAILTVLTTTTVVVIIPYWRTLAGMDFHAGMNGNGDFHKHDLPENKAAWKKALALSINVGIIGLMIVFSHTPVMMLLTLFLFYIFHDVFHAYHSPMKFMDGFRVAAFLYGILALGTLQRWWIEPLIHELDDGTLYFSIAGLTTIMDNALLTYLVSLVEGIEQSLLILIVWAALAAGGALLPANAPNPIAKVEMQTIFPNQEPSMVQWFINALPSTIIALVIGLLI